MTPLPRPRIGQTHRPSSIPADPSQWSEKSKQSVAFDYVKEYKDILYKCCRCKVDCVFTAQDQKWTFEVKKASFDQRRILCAECWSESHRIGATLRECEEQWATTKSKLQTDKAFLSDWLAALTSLEAYAYNEPDTARKNMLAKLIAKAP